MAEVARPSIRARDPARLILVGSLIAVVVLAAIRIGLGGFDAMGTDQGRYVFTGLALLDGRGFSTESGEPFLFRSPAYPLFLASAFRVGGELGSGVAALLISLGGLSFGVWQAGRIGRPIAAAATAALFASVPIVWEQLASLGVDMPQAALFLTALPLLWTPRTIRWIAAGLVLGLAILVKETVAPAAAVLPLAWLPIFSRLTWGRWVGLTTAFAATIVIAVSWWWLYVWFMTGQFFPLNSLDAIVSDAGDVAGPAPSIRPVVVMGVAVITGPLLLRLRGGDPRVRVLIAAMVGASPAGIVTFMEGQPARNVLPLLLVTCLAVGILIGEVTRSISGARLRVALAALASIAIIGVGLGQSAVHPANRDPLPAQAAAFVEPHLSTGDAIISSMRYRSVLGVALFDDAVEVQPIPARPVDPLVPADSYLWLGLRRGTLFGITRQNWANVVGKPGAAFLVVGEPHPLSPTELLPVLATDIGLRNGLQLVRQLDAATGSVQIFEIEAGAVATPPAIRLHAEPAALLAWLSSATDGGQPDPVGGLLAANPVTPRRASGLGVLFDRLGGGACFRSIREGAERRITIEVRRDQKRCLSVQQLRP